MSEGCFRLTVESSFGDLAAIIADQDYADVVDFIRTIDAYIGDSEFTDLLKYELSKPVLKELEMDSE